MFRDGRFVGFRSISTIEALVVRGLIDLERNKKGYVVAAHERHLTELPVDTPTRSTNGSAMRPTRYSFEDMAIAGRPWDLRRLNGARTGVHYAPPQVRPIFLRVVLDCLV